jgi:hypothetical protein
MPLSCGCSNRRTLAPDEPDDPPPDELPPEKLLLPDEPDELPLDELAPDELGDPLLDELPLDDLAPEEVDDPRPDELPLDELAPAELSELLLELPDELPEPLEIDALGSRPETLELTTATLVEEVPAALASLEPPQAAWAAVRVRTATPWPRIRQFLPIYMSHRLSN